MPCFIRNFLLLFCVLDTSLAYSQAPTASFTYTILNGKPCGSAYVQFNAAGSTGSGLSYHWTGIGTVSTSNGQPTASLVGPGNHTVTLVVSNANGPSQPFTKTITVYDTPKVNFIGAPLTGCPPLDVTFTHTGQTGAPGAATFMWASSPATPQTVTHNATPPTVGTGTLRFPAGAHDVTLKVTNSHGCVASVKKSAYVNVLPDLITDFAASSTVLCDVSESVTFTASPIVPSVGPYSCMWNFGQPPGAGPVPITTSPVKTYSAPGTYSVTLVVSDGNGCKDTIHKPQYIQVMNVQAGFTGPTSACIGTPVTFTSTTTPGGATCDWDYGSGETPDNGVQPGVTHVFVTSGVKTVRMIATVNGCPDTAYRTITIHPKPTINVTISPDPPCPAPSNVTLTATGGTTYLWDFGDGSGLQGPASTINHVYNPCGWYSPTIYATDGFGCKDTVTKPDLVKMYCGEFKIEIPFNVVKDSCAPHTVKFGTVSRAWWFHPAPGGALGAYPVPVATYYWHFGEPNATSNQPTPSHTYNNPGVYKVTLKVVTINGCAFYDTLEVFIGTKPIASFTVDTTICAGQKLFFVNTGSVPGYVGGYILDTWDFGDTKGTVNPGISNAYHIYDTAGSFCTNLVINYNGCFSDPFERCNIVVDSPVAKMHYGLNCNDRLKVNFFNGSYGYTSHQWYFGDGPTSTSTAEDPVHTYPAYGKYYITLVTFNSRSGCSDTLADSIELINPTPFVTAGDTTLCKGDKTQFHAGFTNPLSGSTVYKWYINDVFLTEDSLVNYTHQFPQEGYYKIKVVLEDKMGCTDSAVKDNWVLVSKPAVDFSGTPPVGCVPHTVSFTDNSLQVPGATSGLPGAPLTSRRWEFASPLLGVTLSGPTVSYTYNAVGTYDVKLIVTDASGCKDSIFKQGYISSHKPKAAFVVNDTTACLDQALTFTNASPTATGFKWYFGNGDSSLLSSAAYVYKQTGVYTITLIVTDAVGCKDTAKKMQHIDVRKPIAAFTPTDTAGICKPMFVHFKADTSRGPNKLYWIFQGSNNNPGWWNPVEPFFNSGKHLVSLIVTDSFGCKDTAYGNVSVLGYDGVFDYTPLTGCAPLEVNFNMQLTNIPSLIWDFNDGSTLISNNKTEKHTYTMPGSYLPRVIMTDTSGCSAASLGLDTIKVDGIEADFISTPLCEGAMVTFTDTSRGMFSSAAQWQWTFHTGQVNSTKTPKHYYPKAGTYKVNLVVTSAKGCKDTITRDIEIHKLPDISAGADTIICLHDAAQLLGTGGVYYTWSPASDLSCINCPDPLAKPLAKTEYTVIGTDANKCSDTDRVVVDLKFKVTSITGEGGEICFDETIKLAVSGAHSYQWTPAGLLDDSRSANPIAKPGSNTRFMVIAFEGSCIPDTNFVDVTVHPKPTVRASGGTTIVAGNEAPLNAEGNLIQSFLWKPTETLNCPTCPNPIARPIRTTVYTVTVTSQHGCSDSDKVAIKVLCDKSQLFIPNTFTPNGDGQNDMFYPRGVGFDNIRSFRVFNRWGEVVFEKRSFMLNDRTSGWDGTFRGQTLPPDVFMYIVEADCEDGEMVLWKGDVTLIR